ncbi:Metallopeptidase family M24 [Ceratobasidium sp. AG-Ba]|nr:Metallopeptidase family M24 [Ceratobasidium sp. AG-Ba]
MPEPYSRLTRFGQPLSVSHPHLVAPGELTPGVQATEYVERRRKLMESLPGGSAVVIRSAELKYMSGQIFYKFRQDSDFWYLTGIEEQNAAAILHKDFDTAGYRMHLFVAEGNTSDALWNGPRTGLQISKTTFGADEVSPISQFPRALREAGKRSTQLYADTKHHVSGATEELAEDILRKLRPRSLSNYLANLRRVKSPAEQKIMRKAGDVSGTAHAKTMRFAQSAKSEAQLAAHFEYLCALAGSQRPAYVPVVASWTNALIIHYTRNDCLLQQGELVLMDAGCEYNGYASDITRTFPVGPSGTFSSPQKELYAAVLQVQKRLIQLCTESAGESLNSLHSRSVQELATVLTEIGFDLGAGERRMDILYPHFLSHPIGIDLHETNGQRHQTLVEGQVVTIEPGVYVPPDPAFPKWFHNIGIRIEDEVLVERDTAQVLTVNAPKEIADIEAVCQGLVDVGPY